MLIPASPANLNMSDADSDDLSILHQTDWLILTMSLLHLSPGKDWIDSNHDLVDQALSTAGCMFR